MFASIFKRAQATVDSAIGQAVNRAFIAVPFLVALGFATAALSLRVNREYGAETGNLIVSSLFVAFGLMAALAVSLRRSPADRPAADAEQPVSTFEASSSTVDPPALTEADRELVLAALASAAPIALPGLIRTILRNLPLTLIILIAIYILTRPDVAGQSGGEEGSSAGSH